MCGADDSRRIMMGGYLRYVERYECASIIVLVHHSLFSVPVLGKTFMWGVQFQMLYISGE